MLDVKIAEAAFQIAKDNLAFARLNKSQKRVAIAKDVLKWVNLKRIKPKATCYMEAKLDDNERIKSCTACALGSLFAVSMDRLPGVAFTGDDDTMREALAPYFTEEQLRLIETAFERNDFRPIDDNGNTIGSDPFVKELCRDGFGDEYWDSVTNDNGEPVTAKNAWGRAIEFGRKYKKDTDRLEAIMKNIIENDGTFRP